jgi:hypothetical protein
VFTWVGCDLDGLGTALLVDGGAHGLAGEDQGHGGDDGGFEEHLDCWGRVDLEGCLFRWLLGKD